MIKVNNLEFSINESVLLENIFLQIKKNEFVGLIGPNGSGKSTLLKNIYHHYKPTKGAVYIDGDDVQGLRSKEMAKRMAVVSQENSVGFDFSVKEIVMMGRYAHHQFLKDSSGKDESICIEALELVGMQEFQKRSFLSLSGGEKQRVYMAAAFAQQSRILILDEPTNHLDIGYQMLLMETISRQKKSQELTVFTSVHDMNLAAWYCDRIIVLNHGKIAAEGTPEEIFTPELIKEVFHVETEISRRKKDGKLQIHYLRYSS